MVQLSNEQATNPGSVLSLGSRVGRTSCCLSSIRSSWPIFIHSPFYETSSHAKDCFPNLKDWQGPVACLHLVDLLHEAPYHSGLDHHALIRFYCRIQTRMKITYNHDDNQNSGGMEGGLILSVLLDPYSPEYKEEQEVTLAKFLNSIKCKC